MPDKYLPRFQPNSSLEEEQEELLEAIQSAFDAHEPGTTAARRNEVCLELLTHLASGLKAESGYIN